MKLFDIISSPWAVQPDQLREMHAIYERHLNGGQLDLAAIEARLGRPLANEQQEYTVREGGVAVLPIEGVIAPKANMFTRVSGGASAQMLILQLESAVADPSVQSIILYIDSPGGSVYGSPELAAAVYELAQIKPIVAVTDGVMASAAYWIGSAANAVFISGLTVNVGSIGVVAVHRHTIEGPTTKTTEITAGRYKRMGSGMEPLDAESRAYLQSQVDQVYSVFVDAVAQHRGVSVDVVLADMADGRIFVGQQAIDAGLVDGVATLEQLVQQMAAEPMKYARRSIARPAASRAAASGRKVPRTDTEKAAEARAYAQDHGLSFVAAFKALGFDGDGFADAPVAVAAMTDAQFVAAAEKLAKVENISMTQAFKKLGVHERMGAQASAGAGAGADADATEPPLGQVPQPAPAMTAEAQQAWVEQAEAYAKKHQVTVMHALKALNYPG